MPHARRFARALLVTLLALPAHADPIHAVADGGYWHHDSNWTFPERVGAFTRVGNAQDVAGSRDAVAWYALEENGARTLISVDVYPQDSALSPAQWAAAKAALERDLGPAKAAPEVTFAVDGPKSLSATRVVYEYAEPAKVVALYFIPAGDWRVLIRATVPSAAATLEPLDAFVRAQRWDTLASN